MRRLILYSLAAHLIVLGLIFTVPLVAEKKVEPREVYRVNFVELPGSIPEKKSAHEKPVAKKAKSRKKSPLPEKKKANPREHTEKKKEPPKPEKTAEKKPPVVPAPAEKAVAKKEAEPKQKPEPRNANKAGAATAKKAKDSEVQKGRPLQTTEREAKEQASAPAGKETALAGSMGLKGVGKLSLENVDFPYSYYLAIMQRKIAEHWDPVYGEFEKRGGRRVVVFFKVLREGDIVDLRVEKSSGKELLDKSALTAIMKANPLPPLPHEFDGSELRVHFGFEYSGEG